MDTNPRILSLNRAIEFEREGLKYYSQAIDKSKNPTTQSMFKMLVEEEDKHVSFLANLYDRLKTQDKWPEEITISIDKDFKLIFKEEASRIDANVKVATDELEALEFAIKMENRGMQMYLELCEKATDPNEKQLYALLAEWEKGHAEYCEDFYNYFQDKGMFTEE
jgi:rubrerythrin